MAKGGNNQRSNGSRLTKPYNVSNSFVTKVATRVSDYLGGWFGTPAKSSNVTETRDSCTSAMEVPANRHFFESYDARRSMLSQRYLDSQDNDSNSSPAKRFKTSDIERTRVDFPISPIPSTSAMFHSTVTETYDVEQKEFEMTKPRQANNIAPSTSTTTTGDIKTNGTADNHSDSSESTSGCSSLVPQSDRFSQSAYVSSSRKRNLEDKLKYAHQLQKSRDSKFLNRSMPFTDIGRERKKPSFDATVYGAVTLDKSLLREKLVGSPFYNGQTSYGGASAYRSSRNTFYSLKNSRNLTNKREGTQVQVKPSHSGSTECLTNMSHTAKKILEALEQFSTPVNDAKRIPVNRMTPLGSKRRRFDDLPEKTLRLSTPVSPLNPNPGPVITGLNVPTVPDLLKLKRLERIQNSTAAARQVAVQKEEYKLPIQVNNTSNRSSKIVTKLKDKHKDVSFEKLEEVNLPNIPLPITTLPKFDFKVVQEIQPTVKEINATDGSNKKNEIVDVDNKQNGKSSVFKFSVPIPVSLSSMPESTIRKNSFTFSEPINAINKNNETDQKVSTSLLSFMSGDAVAKLKRKSINEVTFKSNLTPTSTELNSGSVVDFLKKSVGKEEENGKGAIESASGTWECCSCLIRNVNHNKICCGCKKEKVNDKKEKTLPISPKLEVSASKTITTTTTTTTTTTKTSISGFGDKFKPPSGSWSCKECFVINNETAVKCIACETPKAGETGSQKKIPEPEAPKPLITAGFGDMFKRKSNQWECSVCLINNNESDSKCAACETPKPGTKPEKVEPKFNFGIPPSGGNFVFGIDKANDVNGSGVKSVADSSSFKIQSNGTESSKNVAPSPFNPISTSVGVFTFGIPPTAPKSVQNEQTDTTSKTETVNNNRFLVTSTSGSGPKKNDSFSEAKLEKDAKEKSGEIKNDKPNDTKETGNEAAKLFTFGTSNKSLSSPKLGFPVEESKEKSNETPAKNTTFIFGNNLNSLDTVSSSTTDFSLKQSKPVALQPSVAESDSNKPNLFQIKPQTETMSSFGTGATKPLENNEADQKPSSFSVPSTSSSLFSTSTSNQFNNSSKMVFSSATSLSSVGSNQGSMSSNCMPFSMPTQSLTPSSNFNSQPSPAGPTIGFGIVPTTTGKPSTEGSQIFSTSAFGTVPNPFSSPAAPTNPEPPKPFGISNFPRNPNTPFGSSFTQPSVPEKTVQPFVFGAASTPSSAVTTTASAPPTAPSTNLFGTTAPSANPFGTSSTPSSNLFGSTTPSNNIFGSASPANLFGNANSPANFFGAPTPSNNLGGGFGLPKADSLSTGTPSPFGTSNVFKQNSAPAHFESSAPKFNFGAPQQVSGPLQFGATAPSSSQVHSAPTDKGFNLSIPSKFNFTGGQTPVFGAEPDPNPQVKPERKLIKAVRRTNPRRDN